MAAEHQNSKSEYGHFLNPHDYRQQDRPKLLAAPRTFTCSKLLKPNSPILNFRTPLCGNIVRQLAVIRAANRDLHSGIFG
jgi:hypothetical protein